MIDFGALCPEINSAKIYAGPGPTSLAAAAAAWDGLATELHHASSFYRSVIAGLTTTRWMGPSSLAMASAFAPYMAWTAGAAARAAEAAGQAMQAVEIYEAAFAMTVPPPAIATNRVQLAVLVATNFFGQNAAAIAATEAEYAEMWAQDAAAMYQYAANASAACAVTPFTSPPDVVNPVGVAEQATAVAAATSQSQLFSLASIVSSVPAALQGLASPVTASINPSTIGTLALSDMPGWLMAAVTPLYGMSSVLGMASTGQALGNGAAAAASAAGAAGAAAAEGAANAAAAGAGTLGSTVFGSLGTASSLGPLSVPPSWTSVIPAANMSAASALPNAVPGGTTVPPSVLGSLPRLAGAGKSLGPRYGVVPTVMTRPPAAGYA